MTEDQPKIAEAVNQDQDEEIKFLKFSDFSDESKVVCSVFSEARANLARELEGVDVDPLFARASASWSRLSNQVVGHEKLD